MQDGNDRRDFLKKSLFLAASAGLLTSGLMPIAALAQTIGKPMRRADRYEDTFGSILSISLRNSVSWPSNRRLSFWLGGRTSSGWSAETRGGSAHRGQPGAGRDQLSWRELDESLCGVGARCFGWPRNQSLLPVVRLYRRFPGDGANEETRFGFLMGRTSNTSGERVSSWPRSPEKELGKSFQHLLKTIDAVTGKNAFFMLGSRHRADADLQHARYPGGRGRHVLRRLEQRRSALFR